MENKSYIRKLIGESLDNIINEYTQQDSFLSDYTSDLNWAIDNIDDVGDAFEASEEDPENIHQEYRRDRFKDLTSLYVNKYNSLKNEMFVNIFRMVKLNSIEDLDTTNIGKHWSFEIDGVGDYGGSHPKTGSMAKGKPFTLEAMAKRYRLDIRI